MDGFISGVYFGWISLRDSNGYAKGQNPTPDVVVNDTVYAPYRLKHPVSFTPSAATREISQRRGGQALRGARPMGISSFGAGTMVLDAFDETFHALISRSKVDTATVTGWSMTGQNVNEADPPAVILGLIFGYTDSTGARAFMTGIFHNTQIETVIPGSSQDGGVNPNPLTYTLTVDQSLRTGMGLLHSATGLDVAEDSDVVTLIRHADPIVVVSWIGDGTEVNWTLPYLPTSDDATGGAQNLVTVNGVKTAVTSISKTTGAVVMASAPTAGAVVQVAYPTRFVTP